ncbi:hypothetical protein IAT38_004328 [Cryptococcus sp. DSM 104549]
MESAGSQDSHPFANFVVAFCGVAYFTAWSYSFYPQIFLNYQRKRTDGLSADFIWVNPLGFLALTIWNWGAYFNPVARRQYQDRHHGHLPQVSASDLAFSLHALVISTITIGQVLWYNRASRRAGEGAGAVPNAEEDGVRGYAVPEPAGQAEQTETSPLLSLVPKLNDPSLVIPPEPHRPSLFAQIGLAALVLASFGAAVLVWAGKSQFLDWLYFVSSLKLIISAVKYVPQVVLNHRLRAMEGFAVGVVICDLIGSILSFTQLAVSSIFVDGDPSGIWANPAKLGLAGLSLAFDLIFIAQKYWLYRKASGDEEVGVERG